MNSNEWSDALITAICRVLKERRLKLDHSVYAVSQKSGVSQQAISYWEKMNRRPTIDGLAKVAKALDMELSELIKAAEKQIR